MDMATNGAYMPLPVVASRRQQCSRGGAEVTEADQGWLAGIFGKFSTGSQAWPDKPADFPNLTLHVRESCGYNSEHR